MKERYCPVVYRLAAIFLALAMTFPVIANATESTEVSRGTAQIFKENPQLSVQSVKTKLKLNKTSATILVDGKITLRATVTGKKGTVKWSSSKKAVATVSAKGVVTGKKKGTATITAKVNGIKKTCKVTVKSIPNVTDSVLKMTGAKAAKKLGIKYIHTTSHIAHLERVVKGSYIRRTAYRKDGWNLYIRDKKTTFYGCKVGMTKKQIAAKLKKAKWNKRKTSKWDDGISWICYKPANKTSYAYKRKGTLEVWFDTKGKVYRIEYHIG